VTVITLLPHDVAVAVAVAAVVADHGYNPFC
jgi:hypothetical protein